MTMNEITTLDLAGCPECDAPAEVVDRFVLDSPDGPVEHVTVQCVRRHRFVMLTDPMAAQRPTLSRRDRAILHAVAAGKVELLVSVEPSLFIDGLCCCDQSAGGRLVRAGLIGTNTTRAVGQRVPAQLTAAGQRRLASIRAG